MVDLARDAWPDVPGGATLVVPVGSTEQHGPHLPFDTDARIAAAVARGVAAQLGERAVLAPALAFGASGEHQAFPGTVSIGTEALTAVLVELGRSACTWASRVVFVNGHGGNGPALRDAVALLVAEGRDVAWVACAAPGGDAHAGRTETSVLLHLDPDAVRLRRAEVGATAPVADLLPALRAHGVAAVSPSGVLGDPTLATAEEGREALAGMTDRAIAAVHAWSRDAASGLLAVPRAAVTT